MVDNCSSSAVVRPDVRSDGAGDVNKVEDEDQTKFDEQFKQLLELV